MKARDPRWGFIVSCLCYSANSLDRGCMLLDGDRISILENLLNFTTLDCQLLLSISTFRGNLALVEEGYTIEGSRNISPTLFSSKWVLFNLILNWAYSEINCLLDQLVATSPLHIHINEIEASRFIFLISIISCRML